MVRRTFLGCMRRMLDLPKIFVKRFFQPYQKLLEMFHGQGTFSRKGPLAAGGKIRPEGFEPPTHRFEVYRSIH